MQITKVNCPTSKYGIKCPYSMTPQGITVHNTANDASAMSEVSYMLGNNNQVSFHYAVDNERVVQGIEENRNTWNCGDGANGFGNRNTIAVEICYSKSGGDRFNKAEELAAEFIASLLKKYGWGIDKVGTHQDRNGKYCPHRTLDLGWKRFLDKVQAYLNKQSQPIPAQNQTGQTLVLPSTAESWRVYPLNKSPRVGNEIGKLAPKKFGGLTYQIIRWAQPDVAIIKTRDFGEVQIFVAKSTGAIIK